MSQTSVSSQSTWRSKIKAMGPGILMASAAVGGSKALQQEAAEGKKYSVIKRVSHDKE